MLACKKLSVNLQASTLFSKQVTINSLRLAGASINLIQDTEGGDYNFKFIIDSLANKPDAAKSKTCLRVKSIIMTNCVVSHTQAYKPTRTGGIDFAHLNISRLNADMSIGNFVSDSLVEAKLNKFTCHEKSGLLIRQLHFNLKADNTHIEVSNFKLKANNSEIGIPQTSLAFKKGLKANRPTGHINKATASLNTRDIKLFTPSLKLPAETISACGDLRLNGRKLIVEKLSINREKHFIINGKAIANFAPSNFSIDTRIGMLKISNKEAERWLDVFPQIGKQNRQLIARIGDTEASGSFSLSRNRLYADIKLKTQPGDVTIKVLKAGKRLTASARTNNFNVGQLINRKDIVGQVPISIKLEAQLHDQNHVASAQAAFSADGVELKGYKYNSVNGEMQYDGKQNSVSCNLTLLDPNAQLNAEAKYSLRTKNIDLASSISHLNPAKLKLAGTELDATLAGKLKFKGNAHTPEGKLLLSDLSLAKQSVKYNINAIDLDMRQESAGQKRISLRSDFVQADIKGIISPSTLAESFFHIIRENTVGNKPQHTHELYNDFSFRIRLEENDFLKSVLGKDISTKGTAHLSGYINDLHNDMLIECSIPSLNAYNQTFNNLRSYCKSNSKGLDFLTQFERPSGDDHIAVVAEAHNSNHKIESSLEWRSSEGNVFSGRLDGRTVFKPNEQTVTTIKPSTIVIEDSVWNVTAHEVKTSKDGLEISNFRIFHGPRHLVVNGGLTPDNNDFLAVDLQQISLEYVFDLINFHPVEFKGNATGKATIRNTIKQPEVNLNMHVDNFIFNDGYMGDMNISGGWDKQSQKVSLDAHITDTLGAKTRVYGDVFTQQKKLSLNFDADSTNLEFLNSFIPDVISDIEGRFRGYVHLGGTFDELELTGDGLAWLKMRMQPLSVTYKTRGDSVHLRPTEIQFPNIRLYDEKGNMGLLSGLVRHKHLRNFDYRFTINTDHLLAYRSMPDGDNDFGGTLYATGQAMLHGFPGAFNADITFRPERGTEFVYNADRQENTDQTNIVSFRDGNALSATADSTTSKSKSASPFAERATDVNLNFAVEMNPSAQLRIVLDNSANNYIVCRGNGVVRANYYNKGHFQMYGTYTLADGTYDLTLQDVIKKQFRFREGGKIVFSGNPLDANLQLQAVYTIPAASLGDLNVAQNFQGKNVRVNCLLNFTGNAGAPQVHFDMELPNVSQEEQQMVRNLISTEEDMNMQIVYLLSVGRFYTYNYSALGTGQSQSASAVNSILSGTLSSQLNQILQNALHGQHWSVGTNFQTGNDGWNDLQVEGSFQGQFLSGRLRFGGTLGYRDQQIVGQNGFIGDFNLEYLLTRGGTIRLKAYSEQNDRYFTRNTLTTQGAGIMLQKDFNGFGELFGLRKRTTVKQQK